MKKRVIFFVTILCFGIMIRCKEKNQPKKKSIQPFCGEWNCEKTPLEHKNLYSGYLRLVVKKNGNFIMYDVEAGNPGIEGKMVINSKKELTLKCKNSEDFDPPVGWGKMHKTQKIKYQFIRKNKKKKLRLTYGKGKGKTTLVFYKK